MGRMGAALLELVGPHVIRPESRGAVHDAARQAARDERDRLGATVSDYVCGRLTEAVLAVAEHRPLDEPDPPIDVDSEEVPMLPVPSCATTDIPTVARPSIASLLLQPAFNGAPIGTATGFVTIGAGGVHLVTNWHVITGRRPDNGQPMNAQTGAVPDSIIVNHHVVGQLGNWKQVTHPIYDADGRPLWLEHPVHGRNVDVVALPISPTFAEDHGVDFHPHQVTGPDHYKRPGTGRPLSIVGFPFGATGGGSLGIWIQGWIATEPDLDFGGRPSFLIDARTRPGQSGSPVISYQDGGMMQNDDGGSTIFTGVYERLVGIYSGRLNEQSDLGFVWKASALAEILAGQRRGTVGP